MGDECLSVGVRSKDGVRVSLWPSEVAFLRRAAGYVLRRFDVRWIVELGTGSGLSTATLASVLRDTMAPGRARVLSIDDYREADAYGWFRAAAWERIEAAGLGPWVRLSSTSTHAPRWRDWGHRAHLLFIDAGHDYASARADCATWASKVAAGGLVLSHDVQVSSWELYDEDAMRLMQDDGYLGSTMAFGELVRAVDPPLVGRHGSIGWFIMPERREGLRRLTGDTD